MKLLSPIPGEPAPAPTSSAKKHGRSPARASSEFLLDHPLATTLFLALLGALALQLWRPLYHLTDDNLSGWWPITMQFYQRLWAGMWPFVNDSQFSGGYDLLKDATSFSVVSPYIALCSVLVNTRFATWIPDLVSTLNLITIAGAFCWSALALRDSLALKITNGWIILLSLSFAFTPFNLEVGASWIGFLNAQASAAVLVAALFLPSTGKAIPLIAGALLYALFGGHMHPTLYLGLFAGIFTLLVAWALGSWQPILRYAAGGALALLLALPMLAPTLGGFSSGSRSVAMSVAQASSLNIPPLPLLASFLLGPVSVSLVEPVPLHPSSDPLFHCALVFALINLPLVVLLVRHRQWSRLEGSICAVIALLGLFIVRPDWLGQTLAHVPLYRSLRWPFREVGLLQFFTHFLLLLLLGPATWKWARPSAIVGAAMFGLVFLNAPPTFQPFALDRKLILSGETHRFWEQVKNDYGRPLKIVVSGNPDDFYSSRNPAVPFSILGSYNYASIDGLVNVSGYTPTPPASAHLDHVSPFFFSGIFGHREAIYLQQRDPTLLRVSLLRIDPAIVETARGTQRHFFQIAKAGTWNEISVPETDPLLTGH